MWLNVIYVTRATHKIYGWFFTLKEKRFPIWAENKNTDKARVEKDHRAYRDKKKRLRREDFGWLPSSTAFIVKAARALSAGGCPSLYCVLHSHQQRRESKQPVFSSLVVKRDGPRFWSLGRVRNNSWIPLVQQRQDGGLDTSLDLVHSHLWHRRSIAPDFCPQESIQRVSSYRTSFFNNSKLRDSFSNTNMFSPPPSVTEWFRCLWY